MPFTRTYAAALPMKDFLFCYRSSDTSSKRQQVVALLEKMQFLSSLTILHHRPFGQSQAIWLVHPKRSPLQTNRQVGGFPRRILDKAITERWKGASGRLSADPGELPGQGRADNGKKGV
jgi:hypothetical protein